MLLQSYRVGVSTGYYTFEPAVRKHFEGQGQSQLPAPPSTYISGTASKSAQEEKAAVATAERGRAGTAEQH